MATQTAQPKSTSRWGSLLQQAVAGVESRLDTILADDDKPSGATPSINGPTQPGKREGMVMPVTGKPNADLARRPSTTKKNSRLQERLAKAVITRSGATSSDVSRLPSRSTSPTKTSRSPRSSMDLKADATHVVGHIQGGSEEPQETMTTSHDSLGQPSLQKDVSELASRSSLDLHDMESQRHSADSSGAVHNGVQRASLELPATMSSIMSQVHDEEVVEQMKSDYEAAEIRRQEETHRYLEHIDALQAKLQYLTKEAAEAAKKVIMSEADPGSVEVKLAMKDEKIALLMEEGQKLSQVELKHMTAIKKFRAKATDDERKSKQVEKQADDLASALRLAQEKTKLAETSYQEALNTTKIIPKLREGLDQLRAESGKKDAVIADLRDQLFRAQSMTEANETNKYKELLEKERKIASELRDDLSNAKVERELLDERHRKQYRDLQEKTEREKERAKIADLELRGEIGVLESRLETFRTRAEEVSTGSSGDTQAKLLRQIETLQTQYSVASENWRGIEGSLLARITNLETERGEIAKKEADIRCKARTTATKTRHLEDQLEQATNKAQELEHELREFSRKMSSLHEAQAKSVAEVKQLQEHLSSEKESWQARLEERLEVERREIHSHTPELVSPQLRSEFSVALSRQKASNDKPSPHTRRVQTGSGLGVVGVGMPLPERPMSRRHSGQPSQFSGSGTPHRQDSRSSTPQQSTANGILETPSIQTEQPDDFFDGLVTPATPDRPMNDMFSVSTAAAGPSVQLVERMSAAVRRLESEKAAAKDELDRLSAQRDEAREQVVSLMREAEGKRAADARIVKMEAEVAEINQRYQTTLEMLGEKSELVDELKADVADVKQMYRELVDSTMR